MYIVITEKKKKKKKFIDIAIHHFGPQNLVYT